MFLSGPAQTPRIFVFDSRFRSDSPTVKINFVVPVLAQVHDNTNHDLPPSWFHKNYHNVLYMATLRVHTRKVTRTKPKIFKTIYFR